MKTTQTIILAVLLAIGLGCGYSKKSTTPPAAGTMPTITQLNPSSIAAGSAAFQLEIDGTSFAGNASVTFNGTTMTPTSASAVKIEVMIPATSIMSAGSVPVTVTNPGTPGGPYGGGTSPATSAPMTFTIN
jgi:hypothetical protein